MSVLIHHTEIGEFPSTWEIDRIDSAFDIQQGKQVSSRNRDGEHQRPFLRTKNIFWNRLELTDLDEMHFSESEQTRLELRPKDLLVCEGGSIGRAALWNNEVEGCLYQNHLHRLRVKGKKADAQFSIYWLWFAFDVAKLYFGRGNVTTIPNLSQSKLAELPMAFPPLPEQKKIAHVLSTVQRAIESQERIIQSTTELKEALIHKLFTEGLRGEPQKQTEIGPVPQSWVVAPIKNVAEKPQYGLTAKATKSGKVKFLRITDISDNGVNWETVPFCSSPRENIDTYRLESGDIVFARIGATTGKSYLICDPPEAVFASYLIRVRARRNLEPRFLIQFFQSNSYWRQVDANKNANLKKGVNGSILSEMLVPIPKLDEQTEIADAFSATDQKVQTAAAKRDALLDLFRTLLHELMTAKTRVGNLHLTC